MAFILSLRHALALYDVGIRQMEFNNKKKPLQSKFAKMFKPLFPTIYLQVVFRPMFIKCDF